MKKAYKTRKLANLANFKLAAKPMKQGTWSTLPTFFDVSASLEDLAVPDLEDKPEVTRLAKLTNFETSENAMKQGTWSTLPTFVSVFRRASKTWPHQTLRTNQK